MTACDFPGCTDLATNSATVAGFATGPGRTWSACDTHRAVVRFDALQERPWVLARLAGGEVDR